MKELRDIKLDLLMGNQNPIVDLFNQITKDLKIINTNVYNEEGLEFIYYQPSSNEWIFYQDCKNGKFWCNFTTYWSFFESKLGYLEIQSITKYLVEETLKREVTTPYTESFIFKPLVEEALKREVTTPDGIGSSSLPSVEDALKREVAKPMGTPEFGVTMVEEALKREVAPPSLKLTASYCPVEETLKRKISTPKYENRVFWTVEEALKREIDKE